MLAEFLGLLRMGESYKDKRARWGMYALAFVVLAVGSGVLFLNGAVALAAVLLLLALVFLAPAVKSRSERGL